MLTNSSVLSMFRIRLFMKPTALVLFRTFTMWLVTELGRQSSDIRVTRTQPWEEPVVRLMTLEEVLPIRTEGRKASTQWCRGQLKPRGTSFFHQPLKDDGIIAKLKSRNSIHAYEVSSSRWARLRWRANCEGSNVGGRWCDATPISQSN